MKLRTMKYIVKEGFKGTARNRLMTFASFGVVSISMFVFGAIFVMLLCLNSTMENISAHPEMNVYIKEAITDEQVQELTQRINQMPEISDIQYIDEQQAMEIMKKKFESNPEALEGLEGDNPLPRSYVLKFKKSEEGEHVAQKLQVMKTDNNVAVVESIIYPYDTVAKINSAMNVIRGVSIVVVVLLAVGAVFIVSNTIKLAVFARRKEINIMKYIGATDWFIRWPFIIEGVLIGVIGAGIAFAIVSYGYIYFSGLIPADIELIRMAKFNEFGLTLGMLYLVMGVVIGALGSSRAIRRHLNV